MLFSLILLFLAIAIAFFHYIQGIFSATLSAILTIISAVVALSFSEQLASTMANTKVVEDALSISLVLLFAGIYIVLRMLFDSLVPGNVRVPVLADKIGALAMGVIAALFTTGVVAIAGDALPFGAVPGGYSRFATRNVDGQLEAVNGNPEVDETSESAMISNDLSPTAATKDHIIFWQDDLVVGAMSKLSSGALAGDVPFENVHPDFLDELYGQRIGIQIGAKHTLFSPSNSALRVQGVYAADKPLKQYSFDYVEMALRTDTLDTKLAPADTSLQTLLIVRMAIGDKDSAADADGVFRFSPGSVRLVAGTPDPNIGYRDYHPIAELDPSGSAVALRADDYLLSSMTAGTKTIDLIFLVDNDHLVPATDSQSFLLGPGSFLQVKRYAVVDLANTKVIAGLPPANPDKTPIVLNPNNTTYFAPKLTPAPGGAPSPSPSGAAPTQASTPPAPGSPSTPSNPAVPDHSVHTLELTITGMLKTPTPTAELIDHDKTLVFPTDDNHISLWDVVDHGDSVQHDIAEIPVDPNPTFIAVSADGALGATGSPSNALTLLDLVQHTVTGKVMLGNTVTSAVFSADGKTVAAANAFGTVFFVDVATHQKQRRISPGLSGAVRLVSSPDHSQFLAVGQGEDMFLCSFSSDVAPLKLHGHLPSQGTTAAIPAAVFSPDGSLIASGGADGTMRLWNTATGALADTYDLSSGPVGSVSFSTDNQTLIATTPQSFQFLAATGHKVIRVDPQPVLQSAFMPGGQIYALADPEGIHFCFTLYMATTTALCIEFPARGQVAKLFFNQEGSTLIALYPDGSARLTTYGPPAGLIWHIHH